MNTLGFSKENFALFLDQSVDVHITRIFWFHYFSVNYGPFNLKIWPYIKCTVLIYSLYSWTVSKCNSPCINHNMDFILNFVLGIWDTMCRFHYFSANFDTFVIFENKNVDVHTCRKFLGFMLVLKSNCVFIAYFGIHYVVLSSNGGVWYMNLLTFSFIIDESQRKTFYFLKEILLILVIKFFRFNWQRRDYWVLQKTRCCYWSKWSRQVIVQVSHQRLGNC